MEPALIGYLVFGCLSTLLLLLCFHRFLRASTRERKTGGVSKTAREARPRAVELTVLPAFLRAPPRLPRGGAPPANTASVSAKLEGAAAAARLLRARVQGGLLFTAAAFLIWGLPPIVFGAASLPWPGSSPLIPSKDAIVVAASAALCALRPDEGRAISAGYICAVALSVVMAVAHVALLGWYDGESMALGGSADERWSDSLALTIAASYVAAAVALPLLWRSSPPHERLRRLIGPVRAVFAVDGVLNVTFWAMRTAGKAGDGSCSPGRCAVGLLTGLLYLCCATVVLHRRVRGAALAALSRLGATREERNAAVVASLCSMGKLSRAELLPLAEANFRAIRFDRLKREDLASALGAEGGGGLAARTQPCSLGTCDAFLSHSWHDPEAPKWAALCSWAKRFEAEEGRPPTLWLDRACIDQSRIADSLPCLPVFVAGCKTLLVLAGPTYASRLWCVMELFTFMAMSADSHRICVVPLAAGESEGARREARQQLLASFDRFDAAHARCFLPQDRAALLSVIESTLQLDEFNRWVRSVFRERSRRTSGASAVPVEPSEEPSQLLEPSELEPAGEPPGGGSDEYAQGFP